MYGSQMMGNTNLITKMRPRKLRLLRLEQIGRMHLVFGGIPG
jgi:hypothetical protein